MNPIFNLKLVKDFILEYPSTPASDLKGIKIRITIHDYDKHSKVTELGAVTISTKMLLEAIERSNSGKDLVLELPMVPRIRDVRIFENKIFFKFNIHKYYIFCTFLGFGIYYIWFKLSTNISKIGFQYYESFKFAI